MDGLRELRRGKRRGSRSEIKEVCRVHVTQDFKGQDNKFVFYSESGE